MTLLRSADIYAFLGRSLRRDAAGETLVDALTSGGALEVSDEQVRLHGAEGTSEILR